MQLAEALRYKLEGREIDSRWCHGDFFYCYNPSGRTVALRTDLPSKKKEYQGYRLGV